MKKSIVFLAAAAALIAASCTKEASNPSVREPLDGKVLLSVGVNTRAVTTKAAGDAVADTEAERKINNIDVFLFNGDVLDAYGSAFTQESTADGKATVTGIRATNSTLDVYVVANAPASLKNGITTKTGLLAAVSAFADNGAASFIMQGSSSSVDVSAITPVSGVKKIEGIQLERIVNKVSVAKITKDFSSPAIQASEVKLEGLYIVNAAKEAKYVFQTSDAAPTAADASYWNYNATFADNALISKAYASGSEPVVAASTGTALSEALYFYPNPAAEAASISGIDYVTKLVLKVKVGSKSYWYPVGITQTGTADRNLVYEISNVTLRALGNDTESAGPNEYIDPATVSVEITVKDWVSADIACSYNGDILS